MSTQFAFKGGTKDYTAIYSSGAFWLRSKSWKILRTPADKFLFGVYNKQQLLPGRS